MCKEEQTKRKPMTCAQYKQDLPEFHGLLAALVGFLTAFKRPLVDPVQEDVRGVTKQINGVTGNRVTWKFFKGGEV